MPARAQMTGGDLRLAFQTTVNKELRRRNKHKRLVRKKREKQKGKAIETELKQRREENQRPRTTRFPNIGRLIADAHFSHDAPRNSVFHLSFALHPS
jgi:hypothetical protein